MSSDKKRQIVVTGYGVVCNLGTDLEAMEAVLRAGRPVEFERWDLAVETNARCVLMGAFRGSIDDDTLAVTSQQGRFLGRSSRLALLAARRALARAGLEDRRDLAVVVGSGTGDVNTHIDIQKRLDRSGSLRKVLPTVIPRIMSSTVSANLVNVLGTTGPSFSVSAACAGGAYNMLLSAQLIQTGHTEIALAGGVESADIHFHAGFDSMRAYNSGDNDRPDRASRPYAADRAGFIFSEGAGILILETRAHAQARGATILGTLLGFGMSSDGRKQMVAPAKDGAYRAMASALEHADLDPSGVDYVNTHGTSTPLGDVSEVEAMRSLFNGRCVPYSSTKGYTGHTVTGAGAIEAVFTLRMLQGGWMAPSVNAVPLDSVLADYPPVLEPTDRPMQVALSNSFGFGGTNVSLVLGRD